MSRSFKYHPFISNWDNDPSCKKRLNKSYRRKVKVMLTKNDMFIDPTTKSMSESMWSSRGYYISEREEYYDECMRK